MKKIDKMIVIVVKIVGVIQFMEYIYEIINLL